jgi:Protein of unknown function (DUF1018)
MNITSEQIKRIHTIKNELGWDDDMYRTAMHKWHGVSTSRELSFSGANQFIKHLQAALDELRRTPIAAQEERTPEASLKNACDFFGISPSRNSSTFATLRQLWRIWYLWREVSRCVTDDERKKALVAFLQNHFRIMSFAAMQRSDVTKVIAALTAMKNQNKKAGGEHE